MTVENDITQRDKYLQASYVEFLEFFARIAETVYKDGDTLISKIERLMDHMFQSLLETKRKKVTIEVNYVSESEEEMDEYQYYRAAEVNEDELMDTTSGKGEAVQNATDRLEIGGEGNDQSCHGIVVPHQHTDWACIGRDLPCKAKDPDDVQAREELWESLAKNENGLVALSSVIEGLTGIIPEQKLAEAKPSIMRAFIFAKGGTDYKRKKDHFIEKDKFRILLVALR